MRLTTFPLLAAGVLAAATVVGAADPPAAGAGALATRPADLIPIRTRTPAPFFHKRENARLRGDPAIETPVQAARRPVLVPRGCANLAAGAPVSAGPGNGPADEPLLGTLHQLTDGWKEGTDIVELPAGLRWVQIDLGEVCPVHAVGSRPRGPARG